MFLREKKIKSRAKVFILVLLSLLGCILYSRVTKAGESVRLFLSPASGSYKVGEQFSVSVFLTSGQNINAVRGVIDFNYQNLVIKKFDYSDSIIALWAEKPIERHHHIYFSGGIPTPGFSGKKGKLFTIVFQAVKAGTARLEFVSGSAHLNDGLGTNVLELLQGAVFEIIPVSTLPDKDNGKILIPPVKEPTEAGQISQVEVEVGRTPKRVEIFSPTHPDQNRWYRENRALLLWQLPPGVKVSYILDNSPDTIPAGEVEKVDMQAEFLDLSDGIYYFHLQPKNKYGVGEISHYRLQIDTTPPYFLAVGTLQDSVYESIPQIRFFARDDLSGVDHYEVKIDGGNFIATTSTEFVPTNLSLGEHLVVVKAVDRARNFTLKEKKIKIVPLSIPQFTEVISPLAADQHLTVRGKADPKVKITMEITGEAEQVVSGITSTDEEGSFTYIHPEILPAGVYQVKAQAFLPAGVRSEWSRSVAVEIKPAQFVLLGKVKVYFKYLLSFLTALFVVLLLYLIFILRQQKAKRKMIDKEVEELKRSIDFSFNALRRDLLAEIDEIYKRKKDGSLSKEEEDKLHKLQVDLEVLEGYIKKELKDVERVEGIDDAKGESDTKLDVSKESRENKK